MKSVARKVICLSITLLVFCVFNSYGQKHNLIVQIDGWGNDTVLVLNTLRSDQITRQDTVIADEGCFTYNVDVKSEDLAFVQIARSKDLIFRTVGFLMLEASTIEIIMAPNAKVKIEGNAQKNYVSYKAFGSSFYSDDAKVREKYLQYSIAADSLNKLIENDSGNQELFDRRLVNYERIRDVKLDYIKEKPNTDLAALYTFQMPVMRFMEAYSLLGDNARNGIYKSLLESQLKRTKEYESVQELKAKKTISKGNPAPDFTLKSIDGKNISLSDFRGKWVILDFWGSWCVPCRKGMPKMKAVYEQYKDKMEIIGIACKDNDRNWRNAIKSNDLRWTQLFGDTSVPVSYAIEAYPTKMIVDPDGKIVCKIVGEEPEFYEELDALMK